MAYNDDKIRERIMKLMHRESLSQIEFSEKIGRGQPNVSEIMRGKRKISRGFLQDIQNAFPNLKKEWLMFGEGSMYEGDEILDTSEQPNTRPRIPKTMAEGNIDVFLKNHRSECQEKEVVAQFPDYEFTLILKNDRMSPKYQRGDELAFRKTSIVEWGNDYLVDCVEGPKFKKIFEAKDEDGNKCVKCVSYNKKEYPDFMIPIDKIYGYYKCVGVIRVM